MFPAPIKVESTVVIVKWYKELGGGCVTARVRGFGKGVAPSVYSIFLLLPRGAGSI